MGSRISPHSQCQKCTIGTRTRIRTTPYRNNTTSESYHYGLQSLVLQRSLAFFSDRDLKWVGNGLEDLRDLGDWKSWKLRGTGLTMEFGQLDNGACDAGMWDGAEIQGQNRAWDEGKSPHSRIFSIHGQGHSTFIIQHHSIHGQGLFSIHSFDSTGESSGDPHSRISLLLRDLRDFSHEGMAGLEGGVVSWFQATTPWFPIRPSAARHCHDFHTHVDIHLHSHYSVHSRNPHSFWVHTPLPDKY